MEIDPNAPASIFYPVKFFSYFRGAPFNYCNIPWHCITAMPPIAFFTDFDIP
ncbi:hypothetical protein D1BOALGB6SA_8159 [Olavius sp. associated proteobacterium Delta 1]|nr:hypothetical protein D1BOALGB6SA_8159 [Olavius sp. associated proteobacterium Delta 1]